MDIKSSVKKKSNVFHNYVSLTSDTRTNILYKLTLKSVYSRFSLIKLFSSILIVVVHVLPVFFWGFF